MREFIITTDSNSDMDPVYLADNEVGVIPHYYTVEEEVYGDGRELSNQEFYDAMRAGKKTTTMASNPAVILERFEAYAKQGKDILHISFSSELSCAYNNIVNCANEILESYPEMKIIVIDTLSASLGEGIMIRKAIEMKKEGKTLEETADWIREYCPYINVQFTVDNLDYLYRGGRLSKSSALLGTVINIKPILYVNKEGKLVALSKVRGRKKSLTTLVDNMEERLGEFRDKQIFVGVVHGDCEEDAKYIANMITERFGYTDIVIRPIGPSIGAHSGPGTIGIVFMGDLK
ncbi:MAG: DegV family protein [Lachnospiraceae bacterium]|nr:DegV family protein [Lachnospiraceae bacterium]MDD6627033.1 DegV family protein [Lachnospiraceae bacterium]